MEARAKELIEMIASPQLLPLAIKYAQSNGRMHMAEKLKELMPQFEDQVRIHLNQYITFILWRFTFV